MSNKARVTRSLNRWSRKLHRWGAILCALPLLLVIGTGILLQLKKQVPWVQPPTKSGEVRNATPALAWAEILETARGIEEAGVEDWDDIDRLDVRPLRGVVKVRCRNRWEVQIDLSSGEVLSSTRRRSDLIESLHDGSFFSDVVKLGIFLPCGIILLVLWLTGIWIWWVPWLRRGNNKRKD